VPWLLVLRIDVGRFSDVPALPRAKGVTFARCLSDRNYGPFSGVPALPSGKGVTLPDYSR
jgi:hypothetical protein